MQITLSENEIIEAIQEKYKDFGHVSVALSVGNVNKKRSYKAKLTIPDSIKSTTDYDQIGGYEPADFKAVSDSLKEKETFAPFSEE